MDPTAGVVLHQTVGQSVTEGDVVATLYTDNEVAAREAAPLVWDAFDARPGAARHHTCDL